MKPLNYKEVEAIALELNKNCGVPLQGVTSTLETIELSFWTGQSHLNWLLSLKPNLPMLIPTQSLVHKKNVKKPWVHFLTQHFIDSIFQEASVPNKGERILILKFVNIELGEQEIQINLFPKGVNFILKSQGKQVSFKKVKELAASPLTQADFQVRSFQALRDQWFDARKIVSKKINYEEAFVLQKNKLKKIKGQLAKEMLTKQENRLAYKKVAEELLQQQHLGVDEYYQKYVNKELTPYQNANILFDKYKKEKEKISGGQIRLAEIEQQLQSLSQVTDYKKWYNQHKKIQSRNTVQPRNKKTKFKTTALPKQYKLLCGLSAKNNDELIKFSKPWHIWMHLRDYPSTHGVVPVNKGEKLPFEVLQAAGEQLVKFNFKDKKDKYLGLKFNLIYCEIRFLKKVKGAPGKVTYIKDNNLLISMKK